MKIEIEREDDDRWIEEEIPELKEIFAVSI
jgi:hypothetical protein